MARRRFASCRLALLVVAAIAALGFAPSRALADEEAARKHFRAGVELYDKKQYDRALEEFRAAYREKPSAGIKQNIALSLKGLGRPVEAATALDEALDEGKTTLKPETRAAIEQELAELGKVVGTASVTVVTYEGEEQKPVDGITVLVDDKALPQGAHTRPIRLTPDIHVLGVRVAGYADPPQKKLAFVAGSPVDVKFVVTAGAQGTLTLRPNAPNAVITIDGVEVARGEWSGKVAAGTRKIEVNAPGYRPATLDVNVPAGGSVESPIELSRVGEAPGAYDAPDRKAPKKKRAYVVVQVGLNGGSYRFSQALAEPAGGTRHGATGLALGVRGGYLVGKMFALELLAELGGMTARYRLANTNVPLDSRASIGHWQLTPMARFVTPGKVRFTTAMGFGVHGTSVDATLKLSPSEVEKQGSGVSFSWLGDLGMQLDAGPVYFEGALFLDVHGVGHVRDDQFPYDRLLLASPAVRGGLRVGLGIPF